MTPDVPEIATRFTDPRPVIAVGTVVWLVATVVVLLAGESGHRQLPVCLMGLAVGVLAYSIFWLQRRSARRGDKGAQVGLTDI